MQVTIKFIMRFTKYAYYLYDYTNKKMRYRSERASFYDDIFNHFYAVCPGSY